MITEHHEPRTIMHEQKPRIQNHTEDSGSRPMQESRLPARPSASEDMKLVVKGFITLGARAIRELDRFFRSLRP
jgi:hypothetical protein